MKRKISFLLCFIFVFSVIAYSDAEFTRELFQRLSGAVNEAPVIQLPEYQRTVLDNGMIIYLAVDEQFPVIEMSGFIAGGISQEDQANAGITDIMLTMMLTGTKEMDEEEYLRYKGLHGLTFEMNASSRDYIYLKGNALAEDTDHLVNLISQTLTAPDFDAPYYERHMQNYHKSLIQAKTQDNELLDSYFFSLLYPAHPYSFSKNIDLLLETKDHITKEKLKGWYDSSILPNRTAIAVTGDFKPEEMIVLLKKHFGGWEARDIELAEPVRTENPNYGRIIVVNKPDATGAKIKMGYDFFRYDFEDAVKFSFANRVYGGGGFASRLVDNLRTDKGYVYSVSSYANHAFFWGEYCVSTQVKTENVLHSIEIIKDEMQNIKNGTRPIEKKELFDEINRMNGIFPKYYVHTSNIIDYILFNTEIYGRDSDYLNRYIEEYNSLDENTAQKVFEKYTYPERFITVIVGNKDIILPQFEEKGITVEIFEIS